MRYITGLTRASDSDDYIMTAYDVESKQHLKTAVNAPNLNLPKERYAREVVLALSHAAFILLMENPAKVQVMLDKTFKPFKD